VSIHSLRGRLKRRLGRVAVVMMVVGAALCVAPTAGAATTVGCPGSGTQIGPPAFGGDDTPGVNRVVFTFVDRSRPTDPDDHDDGPATNRQCRILKTAVRYPTGDAAPLPLILAIHGRDGDPTSLRPLLDTWVRAGYLVAAPFFLVTDKDADDKPTGAAVARQAADARFVLGQLLRLGEDPASPLHDRIDPHEVGAAGMSLGGMTVYGLISNTCCRDRRIRAAVLLAAVHRDFGTGKYVEQHIPVLLIQGDKDRGYHNSVSTYPKLAPPKWFITLHGSAHSPPFEIPRGPKADLVDATTTAFWHAYLNHERAAAHEIVTEVGASDGAASLQRNLKNR
jgi:dienelactone hydrolase